MSTIQRIFQDHAAGYLQRFGDAVPVAHRKAIEAICSCRTGQRGLLVYSCPACGERHVSGSSCGNRHCPVCQNRKALQWVERQMHKLLPCPYFLATFTVPSELRDTARSNPAALYGAMMRSAADSLKTLEADPRFVGCHVAGFSAVMHTWGRQVQYHPHVHVIIPGGGLSADRSQWVAASGQFLVHVKALSVMYRAQMRAALGAAGLLDRIDPAVWTRKWVVHCQAAGDGRTVLKYLGAYVFRVAVSDSRIAHYNGETVTVRYRKVGSNRQRIMQVTPFEFIRRFLQHVLPAGFMKVRHYGFLSPNFSVPIQKIREYICVLYELLRKMISEPNPVGIDATPVRCPNCGTAMLFASCIRAAVTGGLSP